MMPTIVAARQRRWLDDRAAILLLAVAIDLLFGEPAARTHPVVWLGAAIDRLENRAPNPESASSLAFGGIATLGLAAGAGALALTISESSRFLPRLLRSVCVAMLLKPSFALKMLLASGRRVRHALECGDVEGARQHLLSLVSRERDDLSAEECAEAAIESLAENLTDSVVGPWLAYTLFGLPGAWIFRTVNTLDSRWGYRGRYDRLGRCAALLDDLLACLPARLSAILLIVGARAGPGNPLDAWRMLRRDHGLTASPNAGWTMSPMAGALGRRLGKRDHYALNAEAGPCSAADLLRAERIVAAAVAGTVLLLAAGRTFASRRQSRLSKAD